MSALLKVQPGELLSQGPGSVPEGGGQIWQSSDMTDNTCKKSPFKVPEDYFSSLEKRLEAIPSGGGAARPGRNVLRNVAAAAAVAAVVSGGFALLRPASSGQEDADGLSTLEIIRMADLVPVTEPYLIYGSEESEEDDLSETDITEYLITSRATLEYIAYYETVK